MIKPASPPSPPGSLRSMAFADDEARGEHEVEVAREESEVDGRRDVRVLLLRRFVAAAGASAVIASSPSAVPSGIGATVGAKRPHQKASLRKAEASAAGSHGSTIGSGSARSTCPRQRSSEADARGTDADTNAARRTHAPPGVSADSPSRTPCGDAAAARFVACCEDDRSGALHDSARMSRGGRSRASGEARCGDARPQSRRTPPPSRRPGRAS